MGPGKCPSGEAISRKLVKSEKAIWTKIFIAVIQSDENLRIAQMPNKRELVKQTLHYQIDEILLYH